MAILTIPNTFINGTAAIASEVNANFTAVKTFAEGLSDGTNIDASAITTAKLADGSVTTVKLANDSVTADKLAQSIADQLDNIVLEVQVFS